MGRMVAAYSVGKKTEPAVRALVESAGLRLQWADELMRALITRDAETYTAMTEAAKAPGENASVREAYHHAVLAAISAPMEIAALASNTLSTLDEFKESASRHLLSDLGVAAVLSDAAAQAAAYSVRVNVGELGDTSLSTKITGDINKTIDHCARHRESIEAYVRSRLEIASA
jgi:formiminotetrahydrofolate cyclodeaminase